MFFVHCTMEETYLPLPRNTIRSFVFGSQIEDTN
jgi:hypothetical protein